MRERLKMDNTNSTAIGFVKSDSFKNVLRGVGEDLIGVFTKDPVSAFNLYKDIKSVPSAIRDAIFFECLGTFLLNSYQFNPVTQQFEAANLTSLAEALAEASPNEEADYTGQPDKLVEYAKRLIKLLDDCGTHQKALYLASVTRALLSKQIDTKKFFQLCRCIRNLTEEDLLFLSKHISNSPVSEDEDYIDDFRSMGLLYETDDGFAYSRRAFELKKYALLYEHPVEIPDSFPSRARQLKFEEIPDEEILKISK